MRKLKLDPDALLVESFAVRDDAADATGTVRAYSYVTVDPNVNACSEPASQNCQPTDVHLYSCGVSCIDMCLQTGTQPTCDG